MERKHKDKLQKYIAQKKWENYVKWFIWLIRKMSFIIPNITRWFNEVLEETIYIKNNLKLLIIVYLFTKFQFIH